MERHSKEEVMAHLAEKLKRTEPTDVTVDALREILQSRNAGLAQSGVEVVWTVHAMAWDRYRNGWYALTTNCPALQSGDVVRQTEGLHCDICDRAVCYARNEQGDVSVKAWVDVSMNAWGHSVQHGVFVYHLCKDCWDEVPHAAGTAESHYNQDCWGCQRRNR